VKREVSHLSSTPVGSGSSTPLPTLPPVLLLHEPSTALYKHPTTPQTHTGIKSRILAYITVSGCSQAAVLARGISADEAQSAPGTAERNEPVCGGPGEKDVWLVQAVLP